MLEKKYFSYIRVSTARQGQTGTSLIEQRSAIEHYSNKFGMPITKEFLEQETAAKRGRPVFLDMIKALKRRKASGVIMHKIDRSARNLRDWAELVDLIDGGVEVHFVNENLDLYSRGGRLSADIQAVVAADYIRNLREEVVKGFYGRLKQGYYPMPAPIGYLDKGAGQPKEIDTVRSRYVKQAFDLYSTARYSLRSLNKLLNNEGFRTKSGNNMNINSLADILHNPFYAGVIRIKRSGETFEGRHKPIITPHLFDRVQNVFRGKIVPQTNKNDLKNLFLFRKLLTCAQCKRRLIGERQKGNLYYRCQTRGCPQKTIREELVEEKFKELLKGVEFSDFEQRIFKDWFRNEKLSIQENAKESRTGLKLQLDQTQKRLSNLTDALADGFLEKEIYISKKNELILQQQDLKHRLTDVEGHRAQALESTKHFLELAKSAYSSYESAEFTEKRDLVINTTSNFSVTGISVAIKPNPAVELLLKRNVVIDGGAHRDKARTFVAFLSGMFKFFYKQIKAQEGEGEVDLGLSP